MKSTRKVLAMVITLMVLLSTLPTGTMAEDFLISSFDENIPMLDIFSDVIITEDVSPDESTFLLDSSEYVLDYYIVDDEEIDVSEKSEEDDNTFIAIFANESELIFEDSVENKESFLSFSEVSEPSEMTLTRGTTYKIEAMYENANYRLDRNTDFEEIRFYSSSGEWAHYKTYYNTTVSFSLSLGQTTYLTMLSSDVKLNFTGIIVTPIDRDKLSCDFSLFDCTCFDGNGDNNDIPTGDNAEEITLRQGITYKIQPISNENSFDMESSSTNDYFIFESICPWAISGEWHHEMCHVSSSSPAGGSLSVAVYWTMLNCDTIFRFTGLSVTQINRSDIPCDLSLFDCTCFGENKKPQDEVPSDCRAILNIYWTFIDENGNVPTVPFGHLTIFKETLSSVPIATFVTPDMYLVNAYMPSGYAYNHTLGSSAIVPADGDATGYVNIMSSKAWNENNTTVGEYSCYINYVNVDGNIVGKEPRYIAGKYGDIVSINCEIEGYWKDSPIGEYNVPEKVASIRCGIDFEITVRVNKLNNGNSQSEEATTDKPAPVFITGVPDPKFSSNPDTPAPVVITGVPDPKFVNTPSNGSNTGTTVNAENCQSLVGTVLVDFKNNALYSKSITGKGYKDEAKAKKAGKKGYSGQCISYAKRRFYELTGICIDETTVVSYASQMLKENEKSKKVTVIYDTSNIKAPAMAVTEGMTEGKYAGMGHVLIIEYVERDSQGNPIKVYFTESNIGGKLYGPDDGKLQCLSFDKFISTKKPLGYIVPK